MTFLASLGWSWAITTTGLMLGAGILHLVPRLGAGGRRLADWWCAGFPLDVIVTYFTVLPLFLGAILLGWGGFVGAVLGQLTALIAWTLVHEAWHFKTHGRAAILRATNQIAGTVPNLFAVFWTAWAVPFFWAVRVCEYFIYAPLTWTVKLPRYDHREWVAVSRQKFSGLVGHDRIWCLYCDWMTGVWSLGSEMLRNVESFWCPIRYSSHAKCANCAVDFPDINGGWVDADGTMDQVVGALHDHYGANGEVTPRSWWGHPGRSGVQPPPRRPPARHGGGPVDAAIPLRFRGGPVTLKATRDGHILGPATVAGPAKTAPPRSHHGQ